MRLALVAPFKDEERTLSQFLASLERQDRRPDELVLVDDHSADGSAAMAAAFAARWPWATHVSLGPARPAGRTTAPAVRSFLRGAEAIRRGWDVVGKVDTDLDLPSDFLSEIERVFEERPEVGIAGAHLAERWNGHLIRMPCPTGHVHGATKFYRSACFADVAPFPHFLGWDTIDELRAELKGWKCETIGIPSGDPLHLRRMGGRGGTLRGYRLAGSAAWGYGASPLGAVVGAASRGRHPPRPWCGVHYLAGWADAAIHRTPRVEAPVRALARRRLRSQLLGR